MDVKEEYILRGEIVNHWYYVSKGKVLKHVLRDRRVDEVLDVGAGPGVFSRQLLDAGICERALCVDPNYRKEYTEIHNGRKVRFLRSTALKIWISVLFL